MTTRQHGKRVRGASARETKPGTPAHTHNGRVTSAAVSSVRSATPAPSPSIQSFFVPGPLPGANNIVSRHRMVYVRLKQLWGHRIGMEILAAKIKRMDRCHVSFEWREQTGNRAQRRDPDNIMFGQKFVLDALTNTWIIPDDSMDEIVGISHTFMMVPDNPGVLVTLLRETPQCTVQSLDVRFLSQAP